MLQEIPGLSREKAKNLVRNTKFTSPRLLLEVYDDPSKTVKEKQDLLLYAFSNSDAKNSRAEKSLSKQVYTFFTSMDTNTSLAT